jgi:hypothetical protein
MPREQGQVNRHRFATQLGRGSRGVDAVECDERRLRALATGVDTLQFSARGELRSDVVRDLEPWRGLGKAEGGRAPARLWRPGTPFLIKDHGARGSLACPKDPSGPTPWMG